MESNLSVTMERLVFPEFFKTRVIDKLEAKVFHTDCRYDAIIGRDMLDEMGLILDFKNTKMSWDDCHVPMRPFPSSSNKKLPYGAKPDPSPAEQLWYDALEADLEDVGNLQNDLATVFALKSTKFRSIR